MRIGMGLALLGIAPLLTACPPTGSPGSPPPPLTTGCAPASVQTGDGLAMNCAVTGGLPDQLIDPGNPSDSSCRFASVLLSGQSVSVPLALIYGTGGDESPSRVRLDAAIGTSTHNGQLAKARFPGCVGTSGPSVATSAVFSGMHIALIDKTKSPACVFQSRLDLTQFDQSIGQGLMLPVGFATRDSVVRTLAGRLDLELARAVNGLLQPNANVNESGFVSRSGRCDNDYARFTGS